MPNADPPVKLYQELSPELRAEAPLSLLLSNRQPYLVADYPLPFLVALELSPAMEEAYAELAAGRCAS